jgi:hypothetical protein
MGMDQPFCYVEIIVVKFVVNQLSITNLQGDPHELDHTVLVSTKRLKSSKRGELEITAVMMHTLNVMS